MVGDLCVVRVESILASVQKLSSEPSFVGAGHADG